ncbi:unnamed protein product [Polarella glacialis]|uniref:PPPDE domain-containing protein n=1 Tax=Polarella glacialis TaxID=89957 RepID=A0A813G8P4_POLGL|nr:unnamed protein product [Polarella glacialis]
MRLGLDLRSCSSACSQVRSQQRLLQCRTASAALSFPLRGAAAGNSTDRDVLAMMTEDELQEVVLAPYQPEPGDSQADLKLLDVRRLEIPSCRPLESNSVLLHIYNLNGAFVAPNKLLSFSSSSAAVGGAFHVGVEVEGSEWSYGAFGISCNLPRAENGHVYQCSVLMGCISQAPSDVAALLFRMCKSWRGRHYDLVGRNCCSFARKLLEALGVGPMPPWVDRLPRSLHAGRQAGAWAARHAGTATRIASKHSRAAGRLLHKALLHHVPLLMEHARPRMELVASHTLQTLSDGVELLGQGFAGISELTATGEPGSPCSVGDGTPPAHLAKLGLPLLGSVSLVSRPLRPFVISLATSNNSTVKHGAVDVLPPVRFSMPSPPTVTRLISMPPVPVHATPPSKHRLTQVTSFALTALDATSNPSPFGAVAGGSMRLPPHRRFSTGPARASAAAALAGNFAATTRPPQLPARLVSVALPAKGGGGKWQGGSCSKDSLHVLVATTLAPAG